MNVKTKNRIVTPLLVSLLFSQILFAQEIPKVRTKTPVYIDVNKASGSDIYGIQDGFMSIQFHDVVGVSKSMELSIYNWKSELTGKFMLDKVLGLNQYSVQLDEVGIKLDKGSIYLCVLKDEQKNEFKWSIREAIKPQAEILAPQIIVNPIQTSCSEWGAQNLIEFYGEVAGGNSPYTLNWYVLNNSKTEFLYQPKEDAVENTDVISMITVDKSPEYYVMLHVSDACGNTGKKMVLISCQKKKKRISTIFVSPFDDLRLLETKPVKTN